VWFIKTLRAGLFADLPMSEATQDTNGARRGYRFLRFFVSSFLLLYGFAKLFGAQFTILSSELDKPMGQVSGFWLTWYYFGYSSIYGNLIGVVQVLGALLLMFRKTTLLGVFLLLPVIGNIFLINVFYQIDIGTPIVSLLLLGALIGILGFHKKELLEVFWTKQNSAFPDRREAKWMIWVSYAVRVLLILFMMVFTYWTANYNNRLPTPLDGAWEVTSGSVQNDGSGNPLSAVFFERNRAHMCVFKRTDGSYEQHHFDVDPAQRTITIWKEWRWKGDKIFDGSYQLSGAELRLNGKFANSAADTVLVLRKH
jgi:hypothetical protein